MKNPFSKTTPHRRSEFLRVQHTPSKCQDGNSNPLPQVMPPLKLISLEDERRDNNLVDALFNKPAKTVNPSRPSMMNLVYPPLKETDLTVPSKNPGSRTSLKSAQAALYGKLVGSITGNSKSTSDLQTPDQETTVPVPRSVYVNPRMVVPEPEKRRISLKQMHIGWRLLSLVLASGLGYVIFFMYTSPVFKMVTPVIAGNVRVASEEFVKVMDVDGKHSFEIMPSELQKSLQNTFPELVSVDLDFKFPNQMSLRVSEREPVLIWKQGGQTVWIDLFGIPMNPRGEAGNWFVVTAEGEAVNPAVIDPQNNPGVYRAVADPELILMILNLANLTPAGTSIAYDPRYGLGWNDPAGWKVFFGFNTVGFESKLAQYESIVAKLNDQNIQPRIISVQYPYAPFYRLE
ncbi:MAG: hypothetical protein JW704_01650 [Anaerolineaceae bacterium]|nr:hypothetical protein [Anaerolineaceae bacterium]